MHALYQLCAVTVVRMLHACALDWLDELILTTAIINHFCPFAARVALISRCESVEFCSRRFLLLDELRVL